MKPWDRRSWEAVQAGVIHALVVAVVAVALEEKDFGLHARRNYHDSNRVVTDPPSKMGDNRTTTPCYITALPEHILFDIFEYIQPRDGSVKRVPTEVSPVYRNEENGLPYELHLAQVCTTFRSTAFRLRESDCLDVATYAPWKLNGDRKAVQRRSGLAIFLNNPVRIQSVRTVNYPLNYKISRNNALLSVVATNTLKRLTIWGVRKQATFDHIVKALTKANETHQPLRLLSMKIEANNVGLSSGFLAYLESLQTSSLRELALCFSDDAYKTSANPPGRNRLFIPANMSFRSLHAIHFSSLIAFENARASLPNIKRINIISPHHKLLPEIVPVLCALRESSLSSFRWNGFGGEMIVVVFSSTFLNQLTSLALNFELLEYRLFVPSLAKFKFLTSLTYLSLSGPSKLLLCGNVMFMIGQIPARLITLHFNVLDWTMDVLSKGLRSQAGLKEVVIRTSAFLVVGRSEEEMAEDARKLGEELGIPKVEAHHYLGLVEGWVEPIGLTWK
ncbi:hypothetical protein HDV00_003079 [Rhizophlyctis rosea]|nr:hypothetical protein HDV00_003079 [Rhizophlyctis rosea]